MKTKSILFIILFVPVFSAFFSCTDDWSEEKTRSHVNNWIYENMSYFYYWNDYIPDNVDYNSDPEDFFKSLLYKRNTVDGDRFSWIQKSYVDLKNALQGVSSWDTGFEYSFFRTEGEVYYGIVLYTKKDTEVERKGIKRGVVFDKVNGMRITKYNYSSILSGSGNFELSLMVPTDEGSWERKTVVIDKIQSYAENPVYLDTVYYRGSEKIGYLVYNFFASDNGDRSNKYDLALMNAFEKFRQEGVTNLILDLRYNSGGASTCAQYMASALVKNRNTADIFTSFEFNDIMRDYYISKNMEYVMYEKFVDKVADRYDIPDLGDRLDKLYILTGQFTASASEAVINGLRPYIDDKIVLIGETTYGKNVASFTIYDDNDKHNKWGMQPIVCKISNKEGFSGYEGGFIPNIEKEEFVLPLKELGDTQEELLGVAIREITGVPEIRSTIPGTPVRVETKGSSIDIKPASFGMHIDNEKIRKTENVF